jgi:hypothetical protein
MSSVEGTYEEKVNEANKERESGNDDGKNGRKLHRKF